MSSDCRLIDEASPCKKCRIFGQAGRRPLSRFWGVYGDQAKPVHSKSKAGGWRDNAAG